MTTVKRQIIEHLNKRGPLDSAKIGALVGKTRNQLATPLAELQRGGFIERRNSGKPILWGAVCVPEDVPAPRSKTDQERFDDLYIPIPEAGCWIWVGAYRGRKCLKYGSFRLKGRMTAAHRASFMLHKGPIPAGLYVCHICDTPLCVNPDHLFLGTQQENIRDCLDKGRFSIRRGGDANKAKLSEADVRAILSEPKGTSLKEMSQKYGTTVSNISCIRTRKTWTHVEEEA